MEKEQETRITIRFPSALVEELRKAAKEEQRSLNGEVVHAVRGYLAQRKAPREQKRV